ncbi:hypothetical protein Poli38472_008451 [Pythium oligandrum]|uniref:Uncharacterized protein n=1 Tax=Pythium oligandrum TaxID=41045 RepID=A0A8K1C3K3_PYTOL|nr:hypothetical protein Poli38472_008451 [Pythium oligandrum]|eukprot:TMW55803.1 hypothetical protein Poli38472_008451 [Pythium oligandrum]
MSVVSTWGWGGNGQLGHGDRDSRIKPQAIKALAAREALERVVCGSRFTLALTTRGTVFAWGKNDYGQLGSGDTRAQIEPEQVEALRDVTIVSVAAKGSHVLALSADGRLYTWGRGDEGQLGHGDRVSHALPRVVSALAHQRVWLIAAGRSHSVAVTEDGAVYTWGSNEDGALGRPTGSDETSSATPTQVDTLYGVKVTQVECGSRHTVVLTSDKRVFSWGWGIYGQLGLGDATSRDIPTEVVAFRGKKVQKICCGFRHSFAVLPRRLMRSATSSSIAEMLSQSPDPSSPLVDVWGWGWNEHGQLGETTPTKSVLKPQKILALSNVDLHLLAAGGRHTICQLGVNDEVPILELTRGRSETDPRVRHRGSFQTLAWGRSSDGELGIGSVGSTFVPTGLPAFHNRKLLQLSCGWAHSAALSPESPFGREQSTSKWDLFAISKGDIDAFFGLLVQFIIQILLIFQILPMRCGLSTEAVTTKIIPAAAMTVTIGNTFFGFLAAILAQKEGRFDVTALPEGVNTVLVFAYALSVMAPEYDRTHSAERAWEVGLFAAFMTGLLQILCLPFVGLMRRCIPRAALLSSVAGVALAFLTMGFAFEVWENPMIALGPLMLVLVCLGAGVRLPFHIPTGVGALMLGTCSAFFLHAIGYPTSFTPFSEPYEFQVNFLQPDLSLIWRAMTNGEGWKYMSVIVPMVLVNVMSTLANLETAVAVGDNFDPTISILGDSITTIVGACLGNPFPTSVYIGQPIYKSMGARVNYVWLTAVAVTLVSLLNATTLIVNTVPISCGVGFLLWIGLVISASSFNRTPSSNTNHGTAVALGMVPALASWAFQLVQNAMTATWTASGASEKLPLRDVVRLLTTAGVNPSGMIALSQGYLLTSIFLASTMVNIIEREFLVASAWMGVAALLSAVGAVHSFEIDGDTVRGAFGFLPGGLESWSARYSIMYTAIALLLMLFHLQEGEISVAPVRRAFRAIGRRVRRAVEYIRKRGEEERQPLLATADKL